MRRFPARTSPTPALLAAGLAALVGGCALEGGGASALPTALESDRAALAWVGTFRGAGAGMLGMESVEWPEVALRIREEPDSVAEEGCAPCLELSLDTLFAAMHVRASSDVELVVTLEEDGERQVLQLLRYSGGGSVGNVVDATLRVERGSETKLEAHFLLQR